MNTLHKSSAFGLVVFAAWLFSMSQPLRAEPTCPCTPAGGLLPAMIGSGYTAATDPTPLGQCPTHPSPIDGNFTQTQLVIVAGGGGLGLDALFAQVEPGVREGFCDFEGAGGGFGFSADPNAGNAWRCMRDLADACRALGY